MMAGSHLALGLAGWAFAAPHLGFSPLNPVGLGLAGLGSLLPDIDHPRSWVGQRARVVSRPLARVVSHRGVTHSLLAVALGIALLRSHRWLCAPLAVGWLSHLAADLVTPRGLRLAWPLRRHWAVPLCRTGSAREVVIVTLLVAWAAWWMVAGPLGAWAAGRH